jgi:hypothetical protein
MRHRFQVSQTPRTAEADWYGQSGRDTGQEWKIVRHFKQISNCQNESNIAVNRNVLLLAASHLCTPLACRGILIKDHRETPALHGFGSPVGTCVKAPGRVASRRPRRNDECNIATGHSQAGVIRVLYSRQTAHVDSLYDPARPRATRSGSTKAGLVNASCLGRGETVGKPLATKSCAPIFLIEGRCRGLAL